MKKAVSIFTFTIITASLLDAPAMADPVGAVRRIVHTCQTSAPAPINTHRVWVRCSNGHVIHSDTSNTDFDLTAAAGGGGTVSSVALTAPGFLSVAGSPVTTSGTLALSLATQSANRVFAGPSSGSAATPTFRSLVANDLPNTAVSAGSYTKANVTVDAQGRITAAASGGVALGETIGGATATRCLYAGAGGALDDDDGCTYDDSTDVLTLAGGLATGTVTTTGITTLGSGERHKARGVVDADTTITTGDFVVSYGSISTTRVATLPNGNVGAGYLFVVGDGSNSVSSSVKINVQSAGGTIDGVAAGTGVNIVVPRCYAMYESDGTNWHTTFGRNCYAGVVLDSPAIKNGLTASGTASNNFGGSTGDFVTSSGSNTLSGDTTVAASKKLTVRGGLFGATGTAPTCATLAAAGSTATCGNLAGNPTSFRFTITAGGTGGAQGAWVDITYGITWPTKPHCNVQVANVPDTSPTKHYDFYYDYANSTTTVGKFGLRYGTDFLPPLTALQIICIDPNA